MPPFLRLIIKRNGLRVSGAIQGKKQRLLRLGVVAIEKGAFVSSSTTVD